MSTLVFNTSKKPKKFTKLSSNRYYEKKDEEPPINDFLGYCTHCISKTVDDFFLNSSTRDILALAYSGVIQKLLKAEEALLVWRDKPQPTPNSFEDKTIILRGNWPPICEMDDSISEYLINCEVLSLSRNMIENISGLHSLKNLKTLSLAQNRVKSLVGLEVLADSLEELIIAWNMIKELTVLRDMNKLKVLDISHNLVCSMREYYNLMFCPSIEDLTFKNNPICRKFPDNIWRQISIQKLPQLKVLDGNPLVLKS